MKLYSMKTSNPLALKSFGLAALLLCSQSAPGVEYNLVTNSTQTVPGLGGANAIFDKSSLQPTGSGVFDPFLRVRDNDNFEQGFNTSAPGNPPDGFNAINGVWTHDLLLSSLQVVTHFGSGSYYQFILDLGEPGNETAENADNELVLLKTFNLYTGNNDAPTSLEIGDDPNNLGTKRFDLAGNTIMLFDENSGNGQADVNIFVPTSAFAGVTDTYLYLYTEIGKNHIGAPIDGDAEGSYEEFAARTGTSVPDGGATVALMGLALGGLSLSRRFLKVPTA